MDDDFDSGDYGTDTSDKETADDGFEDGVVSDGSMEVESDIDTEVAVGESTDNMLSGIEVENEDITGKDISSAENVEIHSPEAPENINQTINDIRESGLNDEQQMEAVRATINSRLSEIGMDSRLTAEQKVEAMGKLFDELEEENKTDILIPARSEFLDKEQPFDKDGKPNYTWTECMGFKGVPTQESLKAGMVLDRYGPDNGSYVCEVKDGKIQDYEPRGLPYEKNSAMYHQYEVTKDMSDFTQRVENLSVEQIKEIEMQRDMQKPEDERRTPEQLQRDSENRYISIQYDLQVSANRANQIAQENNWNIDSQKFAALRGEIKEAFSYVNEKGEKVKMGGGEQIALPASVNTLTYLGYLEEKK